MAYAEMRLLLSQCFQAVGSVVSGLLAQKVFFKTSTSRLLDVQWTYLSTTMFCVLLALFFYYMPLPEVSDRELERVARSLPVDPKKRSIAGLPLATLALFFAVMGQYTYVAVQESMSIYFNDLLMATMPNGTASMKLAPFDYLLIAHTAFGASRGLAGLITYLSARYPTWRYIPAPRTIMLISAVLTLICSVIIVFLKPIASPDLLVIPIVLFFFCEGPLWPLIFSLGLRGQGHRTKQAAAYITMGASAAAVWPFVIFGIHSAGVKIQMAFIVVVGLAVWTLAYPLFLLFVRDARTMVDSSPSREPPNGTQDMVPGVLGRVDSLVSELNLDDIIRRRHAEAQAASTPGIGTRALRKLSLGLVGRPPNEPGRRMSVRRQPVTPIQSPEESHSFEQRRRIAPWVDPDSP
jgi:fucose permease